MNDPLQHLKSISAPQRPGFREELEQRVHTAIAKKNTPMSQRYSFLKYLLAAPLLATAVYGAVFVINRNSNQPTRWTAQAVQAAVIKSIAETFSDIQNDSVHYQRFHSTDTLDYDYTFETWQAGLNSAVRVSDATSTVTSGYLQSAPTATKRHTCMYEPTGVTFDGPEGSKNVGPWYCQDSELNEPFAIAPTSEVSTTVNLFEQYGQNDWLQVAWATPLRITTQITTDILTVTDDPISTYRFSSLATDANSTDPHAFVNHETDSSYSNSVVIPDLAYLEKYEPTVHVATIYFQNQFNHGASPVYEYDVAMQTLSVVPTNAIHEIVEAYQANALQAEVVLNPHDFVKSNEERLRKLQSTGTLVDYTTDSAGLLHASYTMDNFRNELVIDAHTNEIKQWSLTDNQGITGTVVYEANQSLSVDPATFFTEEHWRALLKDRGVNE